MSWAQAIPLITAGLGLAGQVAAAKSAGAAQGRAQEAQINQGTDAINSRNYATEQNANLLAQQLAAANALDRSRLGIEAPQARANQAALGDILANLQDVQISGVPSHLPNVQVSGGLRPSNLGAGARAAGQGLTAQALQALLSGSDVPPATDFQGAVLDAPKATPTPQAGKSDTFLNYLATIGGLAGAAQQSGVLDRFNKPKTAATVPNATMPIDPRIASGVRF